MICDGTCLATAFTKINQQKHMYVPTLISSTYLDISLFYKF